MTAPGPLDPPPERKIMFLRFFLVLTPLYDEMAPNSGQFEGPTLLTSLLVNDTQGFGHLGVPVKQTIDLLSKQGSCEPNWDQIEPGQFEPNQLLTRTELNWNRVKPDPPHPIPPWRPRFFSLFYFGPVKISHIQAQTSYQ